MARQVRAIFLSSGMHAQDFLRNPTSPRRHAPLAAAGILSIMSQQPPDWDSPTRATFPSNARPGNETLAARDAVPIESAGSMVGPFKLLSMLGEGGFGTVWLAERREPMVQQVAIKIIKPGMDSRAVISRFEQERQALAVMDHPCVARVFDGGMTAAGRPYFVMEYVRGLPLTDFCDQERFSLRNRLRLFRIVCDAVQHAHHKGIVHRDLKPSNVLAARIDEAVAPTSDAEGSLQGLTIKIIDFGIAKALNAEMLGKEVFTEVGQVIGTPEYMSPEQAGGEPDVDSRTDVYSLGVLLYELLTGALPFEPRELRSRGYEEMKRIVREVDPPGPSTKLRNLETTRGESGRLTRIAEARQTSPQNVTRELGRELEWIPLRAMRKDRRERYATPADLAKDIEAYLHGRELQAGPDTAIYKLRKFTARHRIGFLVAGSFTACIFGGTVLVARYAYLAAVQRDIARTATEFLTDDVIAAAAAPGESAPDTGLRVIDLMRAADSNASARFAENPETEIAVRARLASTFTLLGDSEAARRQIARVEELKPGLSDRLDEVSVRLMADRAESLYRDRRSDEAIAELSTLRARLIAARGVDNPTVLDLGNQLGGLYKWSGRYDEAQQVYADVVMRRTTVLGASDGDTLIARHNLALVPEMRARTLSRMEPKTDAVQTQITKLRSEAIEAMTLVVRDASAALGPDDARTLGSRAELLAMCRRSGRLDEAAAEYPALIASMRRVLGSEHWRTLDTEANFARCLMAQNQLKVAEHVLTPCLEGFRARRGRAFEDTLIAGSWLVETLGKLGEPQNAFALANELLADAHTARASDKAMEEFENILNKALEHGGSEAKVSRPPSNLAP